MKGIKYCILANTVLLLLCPLCIYLNLYRVLGFNGYINGLLLLVGMCLFYINHLTLPVNVLLLVVLYVKQIPNRPLCVKQFAFIVVNAVCSIGYIVVYIFYLKASMQMFVV